MRPRADHPGLPICPTMRKPKTRPSLAQQLALAAARYQETAIVPHCARCTASCCRLDPLVLELEWKQVKAFWRLDESRAAFDRRLAAGRGPAEIRAMDGAYFAHGKPCPAYDAARGVCRVYAQTLKPRGCTDFPIYEDGGQVIADLRCEAVDLDALAAWLAHSVGPGRRVVRTADAEFPFVVTLSAPRSDASE